MAAKKGRKTSPALINKKVLAEAIAQVLDDRGLTQTEAGYTMKEAPSQISLVVNGKLDGFSPERLLRMLVSLGHDVEIRTSASKTKAGSVRVSMK